MARTRPIQYSFGSGEISPRLYGRVDKERYFNSLSVLENFSITHHGAAERRWGLHFVAEVKDSTTSPRLVQFQFSTVQTYVLEFGNLYIRFYKDGGRIESPPGTPVEVVTPYAIADVASLKFAQSADTLYIFHSGYAPRKLTRTSHTDWTLKTVVFEPTATYEQRTEPATTLTLGATTGSGITFTLGAALTKDADVGREIKTDSGGRAIITAKAASSYTVDIIEDFPNTGPYAAGDWGIYGSPNCTADPNTTGPLHDICTITASTPTDAPRNSDIGKYVYINGGIVKVTQVGGSTWKGPIVKLLTSGAATTSFSIEAEVWNTTDGYPQNGTFHEGRLYVGPNNLKPQTIWASEVDNFEAFGRGTNDDEAMDFTVASPLVDAIQWIQPISLLFLGTFGGIHRLYGGSTGPVTPTNVSVKNETADGVAANLPVRSGNAILYIARQKARLYELAWSIDAEGYVSQDITLLSDHLGESSPFVDIVYQKYPWSSIRVIRGDGVLCSLAYIRAQNLIGWSRDTTDGLFEWAATTPHWSQNGDTTWFVVKRTINGATKRYIEYLDSTLNTDSALTRTPTGSPVTTISGLSHLEGKTVDVVGDNAVQPQRVVAGGVITINSADAVEVGLHYESKLVTLPLALAQANIQDMVKQFPRVSVRFYNTVNAWVNGTLVPFRTPADDMGAAVPKFSGIKSVVPTGYDIEGKITIEQRSPQPMTVLFITGVVETNDLSFDTV